MKDEDKTKKQLLEELKALRQNHQSFESVLQTLMDNIPDSIYFKNRENRFVMVNKAKADHSNTTPEGMKGKTDFDFLPEEQAKMSFSDDESIVSTGKAIKGKTEKLWRKNGSWSWVSVSKVPWLNEKGEIIGTFGISKDETEQKKKEEERLKRNYQIQRTINSILKIALEPVSLEDQLERVLKVILAIPWLSLKSQGCIFLIEENEDILVMKTQLGLSEKILKGCKEIPFGKCLCGRTALSRKALFTDHINGQHDIKYDGMIPHGHYTLPILSGDTLYGVLNLYVREGHISDQGEQEFLSAVANSIAGIIEHKKTEKEKQKLKEQLAQFEKLSALGRLTANVAHEIRTPLTIIGGFARRLNKQVSGDSKGKEYAEIIGSEVNRLEIILRSVLTYSKESDLKLEKANINDILKESLRNYELLCQEKDIEQIITYTDLPPIELDRNQIREVFDNLISNAIDSISNGGIISIETSCEIIKEKRYVIVKVTDSGEGIPGNEREVIFEPFFTKKVTGHGTGLGLSICKKIVEDHGGFIRLKSTEEPGTTFELFFPL